MEGWIKVHRKMLENPIVCKDADYLAVWVYLLLKASHGICPVMFKGEKIMLQPGQLITGRLKIATDLSVNESKVKRILNAFKTDQQIDQQASNKNSLITILNWESYQKIDQHTDQQMTSERPTTDQQVTTNKNEKNIENEKKVKNKTSNAPVADDSKYQYKEIVEYLNMRTGKSFQVGSKDTRRLIRARINDGFTFDDFRRVIDIKSAEWKGADMDKYLRPATLFGTKFEGYLNQKGGKKIEEPGRNTEPDETDIVRRAIEQGAGAEGFEW